MPETLEQKLQNAVKVQRWIYFSFLMSVFIYLLVLLLITTSHPVESGHAGVIRKVFIALSVLAGTAKFGIQLNWLNKARHYEKCETLDEIIKKYLQRFSVTLAFCLTPALFGLVLVFSTMRLSEYWPFMAVSLFLFATSFPRKKRIQDIVEKNPSRNQLDATAFVGELKTGIDMEEALQKAGDLAGPSLVRRICAFLIDVLLVFGACLLMLKMPTIERYEGSKLFLHANSLTYLFLVVYQLFAVRFFGKTVGCSILGLRIISVTGGRPDLLRSLMRGFLQLWMVFGFFPLLLLLESVIFLIQARRGNPYKRTTWDKVSATVVVQTG